MRHVLKFLSFILLIIILTMGNLRADYKKTDPEYKVFDSFLHWCLPSVLDDHFYEAYSGCKKKAIKRTETFYNLTKTQQYDMLLDECLVSGSSYTTADEIHDDFYALRTGIRRGKRYSCRSKARKLMPSR